MIDYKKYIQVLEILKWQLKHDLTGWFAVSDFSDCTDEMKASAICELFDTDKITNGCIQRIWYYSKYNWTDPVQCNN